MARTLDPFAPRHALLSGATSIFARPNGDFDGDGEGLFDRDCRMLSRHILLFDGAPVEHARTTLLAPYRAISRGVVGWHKGVGGSGAGPRLAEDCLEVSVVRAVGRGLLEKICVQNHSMVARDVRIELFVDADFRDALAFARDVSLRPEVSRLVTMENVLVIGARFTHRGHLHRRTTMVRVRGADARPSYEGFTLDVSLAAQASACFVVEVACATDEELRSPDVLDPEAPSPDDAALEDWRARRATLSSSDVLLDEAFANAADDLFALRLEGSTSEGFVPQAGSPSYTGLYGRDALTASWQGALLGPEMLLATVPTLAAYAGEPDEAFRDEEPRLIHEMRQGPLAELGVFPRSAYFGSVTTPAMFVVALSEAWHWTGDRKLLEAHQEVALQALQWARTRGDRDSDGFIEYETKSSYGSRHQGSQGADEAIRHEDGTVAKTPIATIEEQAYSFIALERMAEMRLFLDDEDGARALIEEARILRERIDQRFWQDDLQYYALALDAKKRPVRAIGSNAGHLLAAGAAKPERARAIADRLLAPDLFNGFGVRTLSSEHPSYNPLAYHLGAVWPVECATFVLGFRRYGLDEHALKLANALLDASAAFVGGRLPEVFGGQPRSPLSPEPCLYPSACWPQAWSASGVILTLQSLLGIYAFAPARLLLVVHPLLPRGVDDLVLDRLRIGDAEVSLHFWRTASEDVRHEVIGRHGDLVVVNAPPPIAVEGRRSWKRWLLHHAPGKTAQILRLAIGDLP